MNSTEHMDYAAETNSQLLFPSLAKYAWGIFKKKWCAIYTLSLSPFLFIISSYLILISTVYMALKISGEESVLLALTSIFRFAPQYVSAVGSIFATVVIIGAVYFSLRASISAIRILEAGDTPVTIRHAWRGVSFKSITSLFAVVILLGIILVGGYVLLVIPMLFLLTFYCNAMFTNVIEGKKGIDSLVLSRQYTKGYGATVFVNLMVIGIVSAIFGFLFQLTMAFSSILLLFVYFGKLSMLAAVGIFILSVIVALLLAVLWKSFSLVFIYSMFKKLQSLKSHIHPDLSQGRKTVKVWLVISLVTITIFAGIMTTWKHGERDQRFRGSQEEGMMMYDEGANFANDYDSEMYEDDAYYLSR